ncbi:MAG TPA: twin-arginine translocation signal domain-containing protein, partial [Armatimonadota bacterium]|nr:twin-arginine translocation signal domain-containing protein [Armatimonadota bacterium]
MASSDMSRRQFLKTTAVSAGALAIGGVAPGRVLGANDRIRFGVIGCGGMGTGHLSGLVKRSEADNLQVVAAC